MSDEEQPTEIHYPPAHSDDGLLTETKESTREEEDDEDDDGEYDDRFDDIDDALERLEKQNVRILTRLDVIARAIGPVSTPPPHPKKEGKKKRG